MMPMSLQYNQWNFLLLVGAGNYEYVRTNTSLLSDAFGVSFPKFAACLFVRWHLWEFLHKWDGVLLQLPNLPWLK